VSLPPTRTAMSTSSGTSTLLTTRLRMRSKSSEPWRQQQHRS
jgi:hypothetical protein